jgi:hypothetical protein
LVDNGLVETWDSDLYQYLAQRTGHTRQEAKQALTQRALFAANGSPAERHPVVRCFASEFPRFWGWVQSVKAYVPKPTDDDATKQKPHRVLARKAQTREREFIIDVVCGRIRRERLDLFASTIHDSVVTLETEAEYVSGIMAEEFAGLGLHPRLKVERY